LREPETKTGVPRADFEAHMQTPYVKAFMKKVSELCEKDSEVCS